MLNTGDPSWSDVTKDREYGRIDTPSVATVDYYGSNIPMSFHVAVLIRVDQKLRNVRSDSERFRRVVRINGLIGGGRILIRGFRERGIRNEAARAAFDPTRSSRVDGSDQPDVGERKGHYDQAKGTVAIDHPFTSICEETRAAALFENAACG